MEISEVSAIFKMTGPERLELFVQSVCQENMAYGISDEEGWALLGDDNDSDILPLFQDPKLAEAFRKAAGFEDHDIEAVTLDELLEWLEELEEDNAMIAVCPNTHLEGAIVEPLDLQKALLEKKG